MGAVRRARKVGVRIVAVLGMILLALVIFLTQTPRGRTLVLREVLRRVEGGIDGTIAVEGISSPGLLRGFTFKGVRLAGPDGRPFLVADSIMAGVSPRTLLAGDLVFTRVVVWSPEVILERLPDQVRMNVVEIFAPGPDGEGPDPGSDAAPGQDTAAPADSGAAAEPGASGADEGEVRSGEEESPGEEEGRIILLRQARIHQGTLHILLPAPGGTRPSAPALAEPAPSGDGWLRRYSFRDIELDLPEANIRSPGQEGEGFRVEALSFLGEVMRSPFRVEGVSGELRRVPGRLLASVREIRLPSSTASGQVEVDWGEEEGVVTRVHGETQGLDLRDLRWIEPRLPAGVARGPFGLEMGPGGLTLNFRDTEVGLSPGRLRATGEITLGSRLRMQELALGMEGVDVEILDPWVRDTLPLEGRAEGELTLDGDLESLMLEGDFALFRGESLAETEVRTRIQVQGTLHLQDSLGVEGFSATLAPLDWGTFSSLSPRMTLRGPGALRVEASGRLVSGISLNAEATHVPADRAPSRVTLTGLVRQDPEDLYLDLDGELGPLSFTSLSRDYPELPLSGEIAGPVSVWGYVSALTVDGRFTTSAGPLSLQVALDARNPAHRYRLDAEGEEFLLSGLVPSLPEPTRLTGRVLASGQGSTREDLQGEATVFLRRGAVGALRVDTAALVARVEDGLLSVDALMAETDVGRIEGGGAFGLAPSAPGGELTLRFESESIHGLRPFLMGEVPTVLEDLSALERDWLVLGGADLDTIPTASEVALEGAVRGQAIFRGGFDDFDGEGSLSFQGFRFRSDFAQSGSLTFQGRGLPGDSARVESHLTTDSLEIRGQSFRSGELELEAGRWDGRGRVALGRDEREDYRARGTFTLDTLGGGTVNLDALLLRFDSVRWNLGGPAAFSWSPRGVEVRDFRLIRPGVGGMRVEADGFIPLEGEGEFVLDVEGLNLDRVARVGEMEMPLEGVVRGRVQFTGSAESPIMEGALSGEGLRFGSLTFAAAESSFRYVDLSLAGDVRLLEGGREVLRVSGSVPADLRFQSGFPSLPDAPVSLDVRVDSFPAAIPLAMVPVMEDVEGTLSGEFHLGGTSRDLQPSGDLRLRNGSVLLPPLGVRYQGVEADFGLNPDARIDVEGRARARGVAEVTGSVTLDPVADPALDLTIQAQDFLATARRDVEARITGEVQVTEHYRRPRVEGSLAVNQGVLMVEELARSAEVVDLSDPLFMDVLEQEEALRPVLRASQNPFLRNLMLDVEVAMGRGSWLRGRDLNVEMSGDLRVFWDRTQRDLALVGELEAVRGVYTALGRQFQVQEGTVSFLGTPGVNPNLDIQALHRLTTAENTRLDIVATVGGTLLNPRVSLSSNAPFPIAESDLVSYLIFGRPSYALASAQNRYVQGAAGSLLGAAGGAGANFALGTISSRIGSVVARDFGLDYLAISQGENADPFGELGFFSGTVATTEVEIGQYVTDDVFAALLWRPLTDLAATSQTQFAGLRLEWRVADLWTLEAFVEDRFARSPLFRSTNLGGFDQKKIFGFFLWREWGY